MHAWDAALAGLGLGVFWVEATFSYLLGWVLDLHLPFREAAETAAAATAVAALAALLPARRAAALRPAVALRYE